MGDLSDGQSHIDIFYSDVLDGRTCRHPRTTLESLFGYVQMIKRLVVFHMVLG